MKKFITALSLVFLLFLSCNSQASSLRNIYIKTAVGITALYPGNTAVFFHTPTNNAQTPAVLYYDTEKPVYFVSESGIGIRLFQPFSLDFSFLYFCPKFDIDTFNFVDPIKQATAYVFLLNGYMNLPALVNRHYRFFDPYVGFGLGFSRNKTGNFDTYNQGVLQSRMSGTTQTDFAYRLIFGLNFHFTMQLLAFLQYSYLNAGNFTIGNSGTNFFNPSSPITIQVRPIFHNYNNQLVFGLLWQFT